jgi:hydroxyethylthiazole kinase-like uncharacterized protein yjeF
MIEVLTVSEMKKADAQCIAEGTSGRLLMERAGKGVAEAACSMLKGEGAVLVACGPGNNGGDGFVAARILLEQRRDVRVALLGDLAKIKGDAASAAAGWTGPIIDLHEASLDGVSLVVDALFGAGLARPLDGDAARFVSMVEKRTVPVLAVDLPSGLDGDTGQPLGPTVRAAATVTFARRKPAHLLMPGREFCGDVRVVDIGISDRIIQGLRPSLFADEPALWRGAFPRPGQSAHKYRRGHVLVASGPSTRTGAARLSARGALRIGAGLVTIASPPDALAENAAHLTAIMLLACEGPPALGSILDDARWTGAILGPGLGVGPRTRDLVAAAASSNARPSLVLDADALTSFAGDAASLRGLLAPLAGRCVLTPHDGEFERLFGRDQAGGRSRSKVDRARGAADEIGAVVVFKGPDTVIAAPGGLTAINETATPYLATAGSGDVLAGFVGGLMGQGMPAFEAAAAAVWLHGSSAQRFGPGLIAEDLPELLPRVLRETLD